MGVYPSPLEDEDVAPSLLKYGSIKEEQMKMVAASDDAKLRLRQERVMSFNRISATECQKHGIEYVDLIQEVMDSNTLKTGKPIVTWRIKMCTLFGRRPFSCGSKNGLG